MNQYSQNIWARYGFHDNPYDTKALSFTSNLPIEKAYVKRKNEEDPGKLMDFFLGTPGGGRIIVEGEAGVGKTTFVNYHKFLWNSKTSEQRLFAPETEISVQKGWGFEDFIINALGTIAGQIRLELGNRKFNKHNFLKEIQSISGVFFQADRSFSANLGLPVFGIGGSVAKSTTISSGDHLQSALKQYLIKTVEFVRDRGYHGIILHFNNMELLQIGDKDNLISLFHDIRDTLQIPNVYFIFVGGLGLFQKVIVPVERVRSIFYDESIIVPPFSRNNILEIINIRYELFGSSTGFIKPFEDEVIVYLNESFQGRIRNIMNTLTNIMSRLPEGLVDSLKLDDVKSSLIRIELQKLRNQGMSDAELDIFKLMLKNKEFSNSSLVMETSKSKQLINKYIRKFLDAEMIQLKEKAGRSTIYRISPALILLADLFDNQNESPPYERIQKH